MHAELISASWLSRSLDVFTPSGAFRVVYDAVGYNGGRWGFDCVSVNGVIAVKVRSLWWFVPRFEFALGSRPAMLEIRVWPWLTLRTFRLSVGGEIVYDDTMRPRVARREAPESILPTLCGGALVLTGLSLVALGQRILTKGLGFVYGVVSVLGGAFLMLVGVALFNHARRAKAPAAREAMSRDDRAPVLYLRCFADDSSEAPAFHPQVALPLAFTTEEEQLAAVFAEIGPFAALGRPGEEFPHLGAVRIYSTDDDWRNRIRELMVRAALVVMRAGAGSSGFWWEVETAAGMVRPERLVFLVPTDYQQYDAFRQRAREYVPCDLPACRDRTPLFWDITLKGLLHFEPDWTPHYSKFNHRSVFGRLNNLHMPYLSILEAGFLPVFDRLHIESPPPT